MAERQFYYAESLGESTTTSASDQDKVTLTFTPDASSTYFFIASWDESINSTSNDVRAKLVKTTATTATYQSNNLEPKDLTPSDYYSSGGLGVFTSGGSPGSETWKIQYSAEGSQTAAIKNAAITAIKKHASDEYGEDLSRTTQNDQTTNTTKLTVSFTPATTGDYIIIAAMDLDCSVSAYGLIDIIGTEYGAGEIRNKDGSNVYTWLFMRKVNLTSGGARAISLKFRTTISGLAAGCANARIIALRADTFDNVYGDQFQTRETQTNQASYVDSNASLTQTPAGTFDHLVLGYAAVDGSSTSASVYANVIDPDVTMSELIFEPDAAADRTSLFTARVKEYAASSKTWKIQSKTEGNVTVGLTDGALCVIQLEAAPTDVLPSVSDTVTPSDVPNVATVNTINKSDTVTPSDVPNVATVNNPTASDTVTPSDVPTVRVDLNPNVSDTVTPSDVPTVKVPELGGISVSDTVTVTDVANVTYPLELTVSDTVTPSEFLNIALVHAPNISDTVTVTDVPTVSIPDMPPISVSDTVTPSDVPNVALVHTLSVSDTVTVEDVPTVRVDLNPNVSDTVTVEDVPNVAKVLTISVYEGGAQFALSFDGTGDRVSIADNAAYPDAADARTISFWMKQDTRTAGVNAAIFEMSNGGSGQAFIVQCADIGGTVYLFTDAVNGANNVTVSGAEIPSLDAWHHIAFVFDGTDWEYYLDGSFVKGGTFSVAINTNTSGIEIGRRTSGASGDFHGLIDDVRLYNRDLTSGEVSALFSNSSPTTSGLVGYWKFDEGTGTSAGDSSTTDNDGTVTNATWTTDIPTALVGYLQVTDVATVSVLSPSPDVNITVSDTVTPSDVVTMLLTSFVSVNDVVTPEDVSNVALVHTLSVSDTVTPSESVTTRVDLNPSVHDTVTVTDAPTDRLEVYISVSETVTPSDVHNVTLVDLISVSDEVTVTDVASVAIPELGGISVFDEVTVTDAPTDRLLVEISVSDAVTVTDVPTVRVDLNPNVFDVVTVTDVATVAIPELGGIAVFDAVTVTDVPTTRLLIEISVTDTVTVTDAPTDRLEVYISTFDAVTVTESITARVDLNPNVFESVTVTDVGTVAIPNLGGISVSDTVTPSEFVSVTFPIEVSVSDTVTPSEFSSVHIDLNPNVFDVVTVTDVPTDRLETYISVSDSVTFTDVPTTRIDLNPNVFESVTVTDAPSTRVDLNPSVQDTITVTDSPSVSVFLHVSVSDTVTVTDVSTVRIDLNPSVQDTITVTDTVTMHLGVTISVSEAITVTDVATVLLGIHVSVSDIVTVTDVVSLVLPVVDRDVFVSDSVTVVDSITAVWTIDILIYESVQVAEFFPEVRFDLSRFVTQGIKPWWEAFRIDPAERPALSSGVDEGGRLSDSRTSYLSD